MQFRLVILLYRYMFTYPNSIYEMLRFKLLACPAQGRHGVHFTDDLACAKALKHR